MCAPLEYLLSIPGKDIRGKLISAFNEWLHLPDDKLAIVKEVIQHRYCEFNRVVLEAALKPMQDR